MDRADSTSPEEVVDDVETSTTLVVRLKNWWNGVDLPAADAEGDAPASDDDTEPAVAVDVGPSTAIDEAAWSQERMEAASVVIGGDCRSPLGAADVIDMVRPVLLNEKKTVLDLSAGVGDAARGVNNEYGAWVTGLEPSRNLAEEGMRRSNEAGVGRKAPVQSYDMDSFELPERSYDCVYAREIFYTVQDKNRLFKMVFETLKGGGEFVFTDFYFGRPGLEVP